MCAWAVHCSRAGGEGDPDRQTALGRRDSNLLPCPVAAERDRKTGRQAERGRQTGRQTGRQAESTLGAAPASPPYPYLHRDD